MVRSRLGWLLLCCVSAFFVAAADLGILTLEARGQSQESLFETLTLFRAGENGYFCYRNSSLIVSPKGTVLVLAEARKRSCRDWDDIDVVLRRSFDYGKTWTDVQVIVDEGPHTMGNTCPVVDRETGTIWLPFCKNNRSVFVMKSTDEGATWSEPVDITGSARDPAWGYVGTGPGHGIQLKSGRLLIPSWADITPALIPWAGQIGPESQKLLDLIFHISLPLIWSSHWRGQSVQLSYVTFSDDHGATWKRGEPLTENASDECEVVETMDGSLYMNMRSRQRTFRRAYARSPDGGQTWSEVRNDATLPEPSCQGSLVRFTDQESFRKNRVLLAHPSKTDARSHMTVRVSYDECRTWPVSRVVTAGPGGYSDLAVAPDMTVLLSYNVPPRRFGKAKVDWGTDTRIDLARFNLEWLTDGSDHLEAKAK